MPHAVVMKLICLNSRVHNRAESWYAPTIAIVAFERGVIADTLGMQVDDDESDSDSIVASRRAPKKRRTDRSLPCKCRALSILSSKLV